jgi:hypothetical protein
VAFEHVDCAHNRNRRVGEKDQKKKLCVFFSSCFCSGLDRWCLTDMASATCSGEGACLLRKMCVVAEMVVCFFFFFFFCKSGTAIVASVASRRGSETSAEQFKHQVCQALRDIRSMWEAGTEGKL